MQRKIFRIEQTMSKPRTMRRETHRVEPLAAPATERDSAAINHAIESSRLELAALARQAGEVSPLGRAGEDLAAAIAGMEKATLRILEVAEAIDERARLLLTNLKDPYNRGLAQDIQDSAARIYEACNFQDISGQRIGKSMTTLKSAEQSVTRMLEAWGGIEQIRRAGRSAASSQLVNGPKLDGDLGHADQRDVDRLFA